MDACLFDEKTQEKEKHSKISKPPNLESLILPWKKKRMMKKEKKKEFAKSAKKMRERRKR